MISSAKNMYLLTFDSRIITPRKKLTNRGAATGKRRLSTVPTTMLNANFSSAETLVMVISFIAIPRNL